LYEQVLYGLIQNIATFFPAGSTRDQYVAAAAKFRIPYWDWAVVPAAGKTPLPDSVQSPLVVVYGPNGPQEISNPLSSYIFDPLNSSDLPDPPVCPNHPPRSHTESDILQFNVYLETLRYPDSLYENASSRDYLVGQQLNNSAASLRSRLYNLLTNYHDYSKFSNEAWIPAPNPALYDSLESVHDSIHGLVGTGGHMSYVTYAAFDPIFMLHHTMVDRVFAMWQVLNPNSR